MTHEITGANTWRATITSPVTGEAVNQDAWDTPVQDLADSIPYLDPQAGSGGGGIVAIRSVADIAALKALTGMAVGDVCLMQGDYPGRLFFFQAADTGLEEPYQVAATDMSGYWLTPTPKYQELIWIDHVAVDSIDAVVNAYQTITGDTDWHDITSMTLTITPGLKAGDTIEVDAHFPVIGDATHTGAFQAVVRYDAADHAVEGSGSYVGPRNGGPDDALPMVCNGRFPMVSTETGVVVKLQGKLSNGAGTLTIGDTSVYLGIKVWRERT
jgi:hypothetical protein